MSNVSPDPMAESISTLSPAEARLQTLLGFLEEYNKAMSPGVPISARDGAEWQRRLWQRLQLVLRTEESEFIRQYQALLEFVATHRNGAFKMPLPFRFPEHVQLTPVELLNYQRLVTLIVQTANPLTRMKNLEQMHLPSLLSKFSGAIADRVSAFYSL